MITGADIIKTARSLEGVPWKHQGRTVEGLDCIGLLVFVGRQHGLTVKDFVSYTRTPNTKMLYSILNEVARPIRREEIQIGSLVFFDFPHPYDTAKKIPHGAFVGDRGRPWSLIHSYAEVGRVTENIWDHTFKFRSAYHLKGVD